MNVANYCYSVEMIDTEEKRKVQFKKLQNEKESNGHYCRCCYCCCCGI